MIISDQSTRDHSATPQADSSKTIYLGADHGGFALKNQLKSWLQQQNYQVVDCGAGDLDPLDDYPDFAFKVAQQVAAQTPAAQPPSSGTAPVLGILLCRSGSGMTIAANKVAGIRAVNVYDEQSAQHAQQDNHANVLAFSADWLNLNKIKKLLAIFLATPVSNEARHWRRIDKILAFEQQP